MKFEIKLSFTVSRASLTAPGRDLEQRESSLDSLVERAEDARSPEMHESYREPEWEDRRRIGFGPAPRKNS